MDPQERALIAAVCVAPDADEPRLVYADWLLRLAKLGLASNFIGDRGVDQLVAAP